MKLKLLGLTISSVDHEEELANAKSREQTLTRLHDELLVKHDHLLKKYNQLMSAHEATCNQHVESIDAATQARDALLGLGTMVSKVAKQGVIDILDRVIPTPPIR